MKRALSFLLAALMLLTLTACGSREEAWQGGAEPMDDISYDPVTLSEYLAGGQRIWFDTIWAWNDSETPQVAKDAEGVLLVTWPDGSTLASPRVYELGKVAQMTDEEIVSMLEDDEQGRYGRYKLVISTDNTGNYTATEEIYYPPSSEDVDWIDSESLTYDCGLYEIYQAYYDGFVKENGKGYFITRVDEDIMFELDPVGTEGVSLDIEYDYTDYEEFLY